MADRTLNGWGLVLKWLVVPVALAASGYWLVGPRIGGQVFEKANIPGLPKTPEGAEPIKVDGGEQKKTYNEPSVEVTATPVGTYRRTQDSEKPRRRRRQTVKKPTPPPEETAPPEDTAPPVDPPVDPPDQDPPQL